MRRILVLVAMLVQMLVLGVARVIIEGGLVSQLPGGRQGVEEGGRQLASGNLLPGGGLSTFNEHQ